MAAWFTAALPFIPDVIKLASPLFTRSKPQDHVPDIVVTQIAELQTASAQNTDIVPGMETNIIDDEGRFRSVTYRNRPSTE